MFRRASFVVPPPFFVKSITRVVRVVRVISIVYSVSATMPPVAEVILTFGQWWQFQQK